MRIRAVRESELELLQEIERAAGQAFRDIGMPEIAEDPPLPVSVLDGYRRAGRAWVADLDGPAGYVITDVVDGHPHVEQVSVHPRAARRGVGRALIGHLAAPVLTLTTFAEVPWNAPYYRRLGFVELADAELTPALREIREREAEHGLDRWPRICMRRCL
ncbi:GNAT superfamily N-acetyltransferase [Actinoplanes lutulentus]|uniref:Acetyltransferase (GNAT) family protein n=1 Tax=Actinoplanes lutulentus TaxID=1287878 RepID=A0A327Z4K7_9ACTN|nr:GNAT family N-acetyltransferase [Actinoplanes lutulentus]MBB2948251.1 GNAT superfamily N-acetyltransferase [Actinoplanes lutulentus]RAK31251.1 acetyltransferase (GNAT) family protein [Actinoplanes lutulentus]